MKLLEELEKRAMLAELDMPDLFNTDYYKLQTLKIPIGVELTTEDKNFVEIEEVRFQNG